MVITLPFTDAMGHDVCVQAPSPPLKTADTLVMSRQPANTGDEEMKPVVVCR